jgi:hypothetical protein
VELTGLTEIWLLAARQGERDENHSRGFGLVRTQFTGAGWMYLSMRQRADAASLQQRPRHCAALYGDMRPRSALYCPD